MSVTMYSTTWCGYCSRLKAPDVARGHRVRRGRHRARPRGSRLVENVNGGNQTVPTLVFPDGSAAPTPRSRTSRRASPRCDLPQSTTAPRLRPNRRVVPSVRQQHHQRVGTEWRRVVTGPGPRDRLPAVARVRITRRRGEAYAGLVPGRRPRPRSGESRAELDRWVEGTWRDGPDATTLVALRGGEVVGVRDLRRRALGPRRARRGTRRGLCRLRPSGGLADGAWGMRLCRRRTTGFAQDGFDAVALWVLTQNERATTFYLREGFRPTGHVTEATDHRLAEARYARDL